jgi:hypothetical protein
MSGFLDFGDGKPIKIAPRPPRKARPRKTRVQLAKAAAESVRLGRQCVEILERLKQGPATNAELAAIALKYTSRLSQLKQAGHTIIATHVTKGTWQYELKG